jgi:REP element-mobilizing transposase RayT
MGSSNPGNANLPIGGVKKGTSAVRENGDPRRRNGTGAVQENGGPRRNPGRAVWHSRGYLPHFESSEVTQHVTFHLADSLPKSAILRLEAELKVLPVKKRDVERRKRVEAWIDAGHGSCLLREPTIAEMVQNSLLAFDALRYRLLAWVVMPNHVHVLFQPLNGWTVATIVTSWKKFTARRIRDILRDSGKRPGASVWHREYWDRFIRDQRHFEQTISYIQQNPVKAGLVKRAEEWRWSSAFAGDGQCVIRENGGPGKGNGKSAIRENGDPGKGSSKGAVRENGSPRGRA